MLAKLLLTMRRLAGIMHRNDVNITHKRVSNFITNI